jgi:hypothetical protein
MSYLEKNEQIHIENVEQLKAVYEVLKNEWNKRYPLDREINYFNGNELYCYVRLFERGVSLNCKKDEYTTITYDQFMSRVNPTTETTIIESVDGKKYKVIVVEEVEEPMTFQEWYDENFMELESFFNTHTYAKKMQNKIVEKYVQYRKTFES